MLLSLAIAFSTLLLGIEQSMASTAPRPAASVPTRGIYLRQEAAQTPRRLDPLVTNSLRVGVNTMVIDLWRRSKNYEKGIEQIQSAGIEYVPRITVFPDGGTAEQVRSRAYWEKKYKLVDYALSLGAKEIQLDYIRYSSKTRASRQNALDIREVLRFFNRRIHARGAHLQIDVFGEAAHRPSLHIGQDMKLFEPLVDSICPMVYPSHYEPYKRHATRPYDTVFDSLTALKEQLGASDVTVLAYVELFNYRYPMSAQQRARYIRAQLRAVREAGVRGWIAWSAGNHYELLFEVLDQLRHGAKKA